MEFRAEELEYAACAARETITCFFPYPGDFYNNRKFMDGQVSSATARYKRLCEYHPGIVAASGWTSTPKKHKTGYPANFPMKIFRVDFILGILHYHLDIVDFSHSAIKDILSLRTLSLVLSKIFKVSLYNMTSTNHQNIIFQKKLFVLLKKTDWREKIKLAKLKVFKTEGKTKCGIQYLVVLISRAALVHQKGCVI